MLNLCEHSGPTLEDFKKTRVLRRICSAVGACLRVDDIIRCESQKTRCAGGLEFGN